MLWYNICGDIFIEVIINSDYGIDVIFKLGKDRVVLIS